MAAVVGLANLTGHDTVPSRNSSVTLTGFELVLTRLRARLQTPSAEAMHPSPWDGRLCEVTSSAQAASPSLSWQRLTWLARVHSLQSFDLDLLLMLLAPEIDTSMQGAYDNAQHPACMGFVSIDLALRLLCPTPEARETARHRFAPDAPLRSDHLIDILPAPASSGSVLAFRLLRLNEQIARFLLQDDEIDTRLTAFCQLTPAHKLTPDRASQACPPSLLSGIDALLQRQPATSIHLNLIGEPGCGQDEIGESLACRLGLALLDADFRTPQAQITPDDLFHLMRAAWLFQALLVIRMPDDMGEVIGQAWHEALWTSLQRMPTTCILHSTAPILPPTSCDVTVWPMRLPRPDTTTRQATWKDQLSRALVPHAIALGDELGARYPLRLDQIRHAAGSGLNAVRNPEGQWPDVGTLQDALGKSACATVRQELADVAQYIAPGSKPAPLVLPDEARALLDDMCQRHAAREHVMHTWGFDARLPYGRGIHALFVGPSGTGKTMAAAHIASRLGLDLFKVDLATVSSKYIGETEKNLNRIFAAAERSQAVLLFDEADALFGRRSEVKDAHDRYANLQVSHLLQKMERHEGITILSTNLRHNMDEAFLRRLTYVVHFPFPDEACRKQIWHGIWPEAMPMGEDVDIDQLARAWRLSGGQIQNAALSAAFMAASDGGVLRACHLNKAAEREYQKVGKALPAGSPVQGA